MTAYVVMEPPGGSEKADAATLVRDGFTWLGLLLPPFWLAWNRLWIEAALAFVAMAVLSALGQTLGLGWAGSLLSILVSLYVGLEGQGWRIARLRRRGWHEWGVVEAGWLDDAEARYVLAADTPAEQPSAEPRMVAGAAPARPAQPGIVLGLTHVPGRR
jgi:hypothetical protein